MTTVAVAVNAGGGSNGSRHAVRWAVENLMSHADRFILIHVMPLITSIPTPSGTHIPIKEMDANVVMMYMQDMKLKSEEIFQPFKRLCNKKQVETLVLEDDNPATALLKYISESGITSLVLGSCSSNCIMRKLKGPSVPSTVLKSAPNTCNIYVISRHKVIKKLRLPSPFSGNGAGENLFAVKEDIEEAFNRQIPGISTDFTESNFGGKLEASSGTDLPEIHSRAYTSSYSFSADANFEYFQEMNHQYLENRNVEIQEAEEIDFLASFPVNKQSEVQAEIEQLRVELQTTISLYNRACEDLVYVQNKVQSLSLGCLEDSRKVNDALEREEALKKIVAEEKSKYLEAMKEVEAARELLAKESQDRHKAELDALQKSSERQNIVDILFSSDKRYRRYTKTEIEVATDFFSKANLIGEGGYGKVYKCSLDYTPVAVKVLRTDASEKKEEFLREVEVLSQLRHPHMVLLLGACPESGCLVYEYMENGSLEDRLFHNEGAPPLPWFVRFRIVFEIACGLTFLHNSMPEPIVHRDLKPGNILLSRNYVSKIGDVGLAKLISDVVPDNITEYGDTILAGTLFYMDPEYQRTGTVRPKSDLYGFGIIILQLLTGRRPNGLIITTENAVKNGSLASILDKSISDWPLVESEELARIALKCSRLRCRDRPDLELEVLPILKNLVNMANSSVQLERGNIYAPSHYFCPILQEIMDDPYIAADGFTYEYIAIRTWLEKHDISPVTRLKLSDTIVTPNHTLHCAIQEWRSHGTFTSS